METEKLEVLAHIGLPGILFCVGRTGPIRLFEDELDAHQFAAVDGLIEALELWREWAIKHRSVVANLNMPMPQTRDALTAAKVPE